VQFFNINSLLRLKEIKQNLVELIPPSWLFHTHCCRNRWHCSPQPLFLSNCCHSFVCCCRTSLYRRPLILLVIILLLLWLKAICSRMHCCQKPLSKVHRLFVESCSSRVQLSLLLIVCEPEGRAYQVVREPDAAGRTCCYCWCVNLLRVGMPGRYVNPSLAGALELNRCRRSYCHCCWVVGTELWRLCVKGYHVPMPTVGFWFEFCCLFTLWFKGVYPPLTHRLKGVCWIYFGCWTIMFVGNSIHVPGI